MLQLDAVNNILAARGLGMTDVLNTAYPEVNEAMQTLRTTARSVLAHGWWFNTERVTLAPTVDGRIYVKSNTISVRNLDPNFPVALQNVSLRHGDSYLFTAPVTVQRTFDVPFDEMPIQASDYIALQAQYIAQRNYDGDSTKTRDIQYSVSEARATLMAEHTRNVRHNQFNTARGQLLQSIRLGLR